MTETKRNEMPATIYASRDASNDPSCDGTWVESRRTATSQDTLYHRADRALGVKGLAFMFRLIAESAANRLASTYPGIADPAVVAFVADDIEAEALRILEAHAKGGEHTQ